MLRSLLTLLVFAAFAGQLAAYPGEVIQSFDTPGMFPTGMTYDGKNLFIGDRKEKKIYVIDPATGNTVREIASPGYWPAGLAWDGEALWNADIKGGLPLSENYNGKIYRVDPEDGTVLRMIDSPSRVAVGLAWDGEYLWCCDNRSDEIIQFSPEDGTTIRHFKSPASNPEGLAFDGRYLWVSDRIKDEIYMVNPETGEVIIIMDAPGNYVRGMAYDGKNLWAIDDEDNKFYKLKIRDSEKYRRTDARRAEVTYIHQISNYGPGNMLSADIHLAVPSNRENQDIRGDIVYSPGTPDFETDQWGQKTAVFKSFGMMPGETLEAQMIVNCTSYDTRWYIFPDEVGGLEQVPADVKDKFLRDNEKYRLTHPTIQKALETCGAKDETNPYWIARRIYNYLLDNMYYEMAGGWNTAPAVLERGNGSCSEYTFVFIAMCRAAGVPARYVGSVVVRGDDASTDDVFHRWAEVYLPNYGWVPFDPSGGDNPWPRDQANYIGHLSNRYLITTQSGGGSDTMQWTYNSNSFYTSEPKAFVIFDKFADWQPVE